LLILIFRGRKRGHWTSMGDIKKLEESTSEYSVKLNRCNYYEREWLTRDIKEAVAKKTDCKCAMCGKHIAVGDKDFTVDHFIPLNKGGNNKIENLIPLCSDCNSKKTDDIIAVYGTLAYLKNKYKKQLIEITRKYLNEYIWLTDKNILMFDSNTMALEVPLWNTKIAHKKRLVTYKVNIKINKIKKLTDEIENFITAYNEFYNMDTSYINEASNNYIDKGFMYEVRKANDDKLIAVFFFNIIDTKDYDEEATPMKLIEISNIICNTAHTDMIDSTRVVLLYTVINDIVMSCRSIGMYTSDICVQFNKAEENYESYRQKFEKYTAGMTGMNEDSNVVASDDMFESRVYGWYTGLKSVKELNEEYDIEDVVHRDRKVLTKQLKSGGY
jgi:5-methylcytosine-specific restriction endonuclease McrA